jgi:hypothetical protein
MSNSIMSDKNNLSDITNKYRKKLEDLQEKIVILSTSDLEELFNGTIIMFINELNNLYNKLIENDDKIKYSSSLYYIEERLSKLNMVVDQLEGKQSFFSVNVTDIIIRGYIKYFYLSYRDLFMDWNIDEIKNTDCSVISDALINGGKEEQIDVSENSLNLIPVIVSIFNNLNYKDNIKFIFLINNLNVIIDRILLDKSSK